MTRRQYEALAKCIYELGWIDRVRELSWTTGILLSDADIQFRLLGQKMKVRIPQLTLFLASIAHAICAKLKWTRKGGGPAGETHIDKPLRTEQGKRK